jgi:Prp8 binding protein
MSFAGTKRGCDDTTLVAAPSGKRANPGGGALVAAGAEGGALIAAGPARTSDLLAPIMLLTGHAGAVLSCKFSPDGQHVLSGSQDKMLLLWDTYGECDNTMNFKGHSNAVLEVHWASDGETAFSCSADKTGALWDAKTGARIRQFRGHTAVVNSLCPSRDSSVLATASDDRSARVWDARVRTCQHTITHPYAVTATCVSHDGMALFTGSLDGRVRWYDLRRWGIANQVMNGHLYLNRAANAFGNDYLKSIDENANPVYAHTAAKKYFGTQEVIYSPNKDEFWPISFRNIED